MAFNTFAELFDSSKIALPSQDIEEGIYSGVLEKTRISNKIPLYWTFVFRLDGNPDNGDYITQLVEHSFNLTNKEGDVIEWQKEPFQRFLVKLMGSQYSHKYAENKEKIEELTNYPVTIKVSKRESKGKTYTDVVAIPDLNRVEEIPSNEVIPVKKLKKGKSVDEDGVPF